MDDKIKILKFEYNEQLIEFQVVHRKRKTLSIKIEESGEVKVSAPIRITNKRILEIVSSKGDWIIKKRREIKEGLSKKVIRKIEDNAPYMYLGNNYYLKINLNKEYKKIKVELIGNNLIINTFYKDEEKIKAALEMWYRERTLELAVKRINYYSIYFTDKVRYIKVKEQKRRWASCTGNNDILFNWRISMAPLEVFDYIVVHEMCHMEHRNHGKDFWKAVENILPDYKERADYLKLNGINMCL